MAAGITPMITSFQGEHRWLSNFWPADVVLDGTLFPTVEHAYVSAKTTDHVVRTSIAAVSSPGAVKRLGRSLELRADWEKVKLPVMEQLLRQKFAHADLRAKLQATGQAWLIEGNTWGDRFWGMVWVDGAIPGWSGDNNLGKLLMKIRDEFPIDEAGGLVG